MVQEFNDESLISDIYSAASGQRPWEPLLHQVAASLKLLLAQIICVDLREKRLIYSHEGGTGSAEATLDYARTYHRVDPHAAALTSAPLGKLYCFSNIISPEEVMKLPFYQDYLIPYGGRHVHGAVVYRGASHAVMVGLHRGNYSTPMREDEFDQAQRLTFHLTRAMQLFADMQPTFAQAAVGRAILDKLQSPVALVTAHRQVVQTNEAFDALVQEGSFLYLDPIGHLRCLLLAADTELGLSLKSLQLSGHAGLESDATPPDRVLVPIQDPRRTTPWVACLLAIRPSETLGAFGPQPMAMMILHDPQRRQAPDAYAIAAAFKLTPAEARVGVALTEGLTPKEIARDFDLSINTIQSQIRSLQAKLGVNRSTAAVLMLQSLPLNSGLV